MTALNEESRNHKNQKDSSSGDHEFVGIYTVYIYRDTEWLITYHK